MSFRRRENVAKSVAEIAMLCGGEIVGDPNNAPPISSLCAIEAANRNGVAFLRSSHLPGARRYLASSPPGALIIEKDIVDHTNYLPCPRIVVPNALAAYATLVPHLYERLNWGEGVDATAVIGDNVSMGPGVTIGAYAIIGDNVRVGAGTVLFPHVVVYPEVVLGASVTVHAHAVIREGVRGGDRSVIQAGAVVGSDGFGYAVVPDRASIHLPHVGSVTLGRNVEVGANTCIDRGMVRDSSIGDNTKIDNLAQIGHNATIGSDTVICGQVGIAGSCTIGSRVVIGGATGIRDHTTICDNVRLAGRSGVITDILEPGDYAGHPAIKASEWRRLAVSQIAAARGGKKRRR